MAKKVLALVACLALVATLVACGGNGTTSSAIAGETDPAKWSGMSIRVAGYRDFSDDPLNYEYGLAADQFEQDYGVDVTFQVGGGDGLGNKDADLAAAIIAGDPWEIQYCFGISTFPLTFVRNLYTPINAFLPLDENGDLKADELDERLSYVTVEGTKWKGNYYGVSELHMQEIWYLAYNETLMQELGIKTPYEYYKEGNWTMDTYKQVNAEALAKGYASRSSVSRPHTGGMYMSSWDLDKGSVEVTYDQEKNYQWLNFWSDLLTDPQYNVTTGGKVATREVIMRDEVMPNLIKDELTEEDNNLTDTIRYIYFPTLATDETGDPSTYLTDDHFLFPEGVQNTGKMPCAYELACCMVDSKGKILKDETYKNNMTEEDYNLFEEALANAYFLPRLFYEGVFNIGAQFMNDMNAGKAVATHVDEQKEALKAKAAEFNEKYSD